MMELNDIVPPLELCKLIPAGEFADSALVWFSNYHFGGWHIEKRGLAEALTDNYELYPAPTLQEILKELDEFEVWGNNISDEHTVVSEFVQYEDENTATAALKVWLKLKGIEE